VEARTAGEIDAALRIRAASAPLRLVLVGAADAEDRLDAIREAGAAVILDPLGAESPARALRAPAALETHGIPFAFAADSPEELRWSIALARLHGASRRAALAATTETPARLLGIADRFGAISAGRRAHLVVFDGDPLSLASRIVEVIRPEKPRKEEP
ncbi:MAG: amidohydrolase family protein, partial [Planctomycetes bacterium]|nr:amidohydrolase family protein [Planctomycetota bacterium]